MTISIENGIVRITYLRIVSEVCRNFQGEERLNQNNEKKLFPTILCTPALLVSDCDCARLDGRAGAGLHAGQGEGGGATRFRGSQIRTSTGTPWFSYRNYNWIRTFFRVKPII